MSAGCAKHCPVRRAACRNLQHPDKRPCTGLQADLNDPALIQRCKVEYTHVPCDVDRRYSGPVAPLNDVLRSYQHVRTAALHALLHFMS